MVSVIFFHDSNWKVKGYRVAFSEPRNTSLENQVHGLLLGTKLALQEAKAYHCKCDDDDLYEVIVMRSNKNTVAVLKPLELALRQLVVTHSNELDVKHF